MDKINNEENSLMMKEFNRDGFPVINLHEEFFEVKAIDFSKFRMFRYSDIHHVEYTNHEGSFPFWPFFELLISKFEPYKFIVKKNNGSSWDYLSPANFNQDFEAIVNEIKRRVNHTNK
jgi:hypothetical protein